MQVIDVRLVPDRAARRGGFEVPVREKYAGAPGVCEFGPGSVEEDRLVVADGARVALPVAMEQAIRTAAGSWR
jgi:hypothetical protein